ncbi:MAG: TonB family protein [Candidatus Latescibacteria bacterium]|nr:TonB family protein [Candidatus Latescibacterota bacterium]NIO55405.1 TonB family protein [Candidatus Latescibacterota bacterium]
MEVYEEFAKNLYGSFELKKYMARYIWIGLAVSVGFHGTAIGSYVLGLALTREPPAPKRIVILDASKLGAPPSITDKTVPPTIKVARPKIAPPAAAKPVAIPDEEAKEEVTIQSQEELAISATATDDTTIFGGEGVEVIIQEMETEDVIPSPDAFTPFEIPPQAILSPKPAYPQMARDVGMEGFVLMKVYVDKKGNVKKWEVMKAEPTGLGFEEEVIKVIPNWKFTPAIQQNQPVGAWIAVPFNFEFKE